MLSTAHQRRPDEGGGGGGGGGRSPPLGLGGFSAQSGAGTPGGQGALTPVRLSPTNTQTHFLGASRGFLAAMVAPEEHSDGDGEGGPVVTLTTPLGGGGMVADVSRGVAANPYHPTIPSREIRWILGHVIGRSFISRVFLGVNAVTRSLLCAKETKEDHIPNLPLRLGRMRRDVRRLQELNRFHSPFLVPVRGADRWANSLFIFSDYYPAVCLKQLLVRFGPMPEAAAACYIGEVLKGLVFLHQHNVTHYNIKSTNVLVGVDGGVRLTDFGAGFLFEDHGATVTTANASLGPPLLCEARATGRWMAPEVVRREATAGFAVDIWAVGCLVLELLTAHVPFYHYGSALNVLIAVGGSDEEMLLPPCLVVHPPLQPDEGGPGTGAGRSRAGSIATSYASDGNSARGGSPRTAPGSHRASAAAPPPPQDAPDAAAAAPAGRTHRISRDCADFLRLCLAKRPRQRPTAHDLLRHPFITKHAKAHSYLHALVAGSHPRSYPHHHSNNSSYANEGRAPTAAAGPRPEREQTVGPWAGGAEAHLPSDSSDASGGTATTGAGGGGVSRVRAFSAVSTVSSSAPCPIRPDTTPAHTLEAPTVLAGTGGGRSGTANPAAAAAAAAVGRGNNAGTAGSSTHDDLSGRWRNTSQAARVAPSNWTVTEGDASTAVHLAPMCLVLPTRPDLWPVCVFRALPRGGSDVSSPCPSPSSPASPSSSPPGSPTLRNRSRKNSRHTNNSHTGGDNEDTAFPSTAADGGGPPAVGPADQAASSRRMSVSANNSSTTQKRRPAPPPPIPLGDQHRQFVLQAVLKAAGAAVGRREAAEMRSHYLTDVHAPMPMPDHHRASHANPHEDEPHPPPHTTVVPMDACGASASASASLSLDDLAAISLVAARAATTDGEQHAYEIILRVEVEERGLLRHVTSAIAKAETSAITQRGGDLGALGLRGGLSADPSMPVPIMAMVLTCLGRIRQQLPRTHHITREASEAALPAGTLGGRGQQGGGSAHPHHLLSHNSSSDISASQQRPARRQRSSHAITILGEGECGDGSTPHHATPGDAAAIIAPATGENGGTDQPKPEAYTTDSNAPQAAGGAGAADAAGADHPHAVASASITDTGKDAVCGANEGGCEARHASSCGTSSRSQQQPAPSSSGGGTGLTTASSSSQLHSDQTSASIIASSGRSQQQQHPSQPPQPQQSQQAKHSSLLLRRGSTLTAASTSGEALAALREADRLLGIAGGAAANNDRHRSSTSADEGGRRSDLFGATVVDDDDEDEDDESGRGRSKGGRARRRDGGGGSNDGGAVFSSPDEEESHRYQENYYTLYERNKGKGSGGGGAGVDPHPRRSTGSGGSSAAAAAGGKYRKGSAKTGPRGDGSVWAEGGSNSNANPTATDSNNRAAANAAEFRGAHELVEYSRSVSSIDRNDDNSRRSAGEEDPPTENHHAGGVAGGGADSRHHHSQSHHSQSQSHRDGTLGSGSTLPARGPHQLVVVKIATGDTGASLFHFLPRAEQGPLGPQARVMLIVITSLAMVITSAIALAVVLNG